MLGDITTVYLYPLFIDHRDKAIKIHEEEKAMEKLALESYVTQLKRKYHRYAKPTFERNWPPIVAEFIKLGYVIHKPKRTRKETDIFARLATSGYENLTSESANMHACDSSGLGVDQNYDNYFDINISIKEEMCDIFLPISNDGCSQIILIEGAPGIGKTRLMAQISFLWAKGKILDDKKVVLFFPLRELIENFVSVKDMFIYACSHKEKAAVECSEYFINNGGQGLVILLDGLDENSQALQEDSFFYKTLIEDNIFDKACIVVTSRPHATVQLQQYANYRVEIIGFTNKRRCEFVQENLKENAEDLEKLLQENHVIDTLCYTPLNMSIVLFLFQEKQRLGDDYPLPDTYTELVHQAVMMTILRNLKKLGVTGLKKDLGNLPEPYKEIFRCLCMFAFDALNKNNVIFTESQIKALCPVRGNMQVQKAVTNGLGLMQNATFFADVSSSTDSLLNFAHFSIQEFLAAWHFTFNYHCFYPLPLKCRCLQFLSQLKVLDALFWEGEYINMWSFYIGLTKGEAPVFKHFLSGTYLLCSCCCKQGKNYSISEKIANNKVKLLLLYYFLQEAPDNDELFQLLNIAVTKNCLDIIGQPVENKKDLELLGYILSRPYLTNQWDKVNLSHCKIDDTNFEVLCNILTRNDRSPKIKALSLSDNKLNLCNEAIVNLVCNKDIKHLNLSNNNLGNLSLSEVCANVLEYLNISNNKIDNKKALRLFESLKYFKNLKVLNLNDNSIGADQDVVDTLGVALCCCDSLEELEICGNMIENEAVLLFEVINKIKNSESNIHYYRLTNKASVFLNILGYCDKIVRHQLSCTNNVQSKVVEKIRKAEVVNVSYNGLKSVDAINLGQCLYLLTNLKLLNVANNCICDDATEALAMGLLLTPNLKEFNFEENLFESSSNMIFTMIQHLRTASNKRTFKCVPVEIEALISIVKCANELDEGKLESNDIVSSLSQITELDLSYVGFREEDKLTSNHLNELWSMLLWFKQLHILDISNNNITDEAMELLVLLMLRIPTIIIRMSGNPLCNNEMYAIAFDIIKSACEKQVQSISCNHNSSHVECQSFLYIMKCLDDPASTWIDSSSAKLAKEDKDLIKSIYYHNILINKHYFKILGITELPNYIKHEKYLGYGPKESDEAVCPPDIVQRFNMLPKHNPEHTLYCMHLRNIFKNITILNVTTKEYHAGEFLECINLLPNLKVLQINDVSIRDRGMEELSYYLRKNITLENLDLSYSNLKHLHINTDPVNKMLKIAKFNYSHITDEVVSKLLIPSNLDVLEIEGNNLSDQGIKTIQRNLSSCEKNVIITRLNLANNNLTSNSAPDIVDIVHLCKVKYLNISSNSLLTIFCHCELRTITTLQELDISSSNQQTCNAVQFAESISCFMSCRSLKKLNISNNNITKQAIDVIYFSFIKCIQLKDVICKNNPAEKEIEVAFCFTRDLYSEHNCVKCIKFKELPKATSTLISQISSDCYTDHDNLTEQITNSVVIQISQVASIDFSCNNLEINENFVSILQGCTHLEFLNLKNNNITNETFKYLATGLLFTSKLSLPNLHLNGNPCMDNIENISILQMIETLRTSNGNFKCPVVKFESFLTVLELVESVSNKPNDVAKAISRIKSLDISHSESSNPYDEDMDAGIKLQSPSIIKFCNYIKYLKSLESMNMSNNNIEENVKNDLVISVLKNSSIIDVQLEGNPIYQVRECVILFDTIRKIRMCGNSCTFKDCPEALEAFVSILNYIDAFDDKTCDFTQNIEHLNISHFCQNSQNFQNPKEISAGLIHHLKLFWKLKTLNLSHAYLTSDALQDLSEFLHNNNTLLQLDISDNDIQAEGALIVLKSLDTNTTLKKIKFEQ